MGVGVEGGTGWTYSTDEIKQKKKQNQSETQHQEANSADPFPARTQPRAHLRVYLLKLKKCDVPHNSLYLPYFAFVRGMNPLCSIMSL